MEDTLNFTNEKKARQYLVFEIAAEKYGIDVRDVKELLDYSEITAVPFSSSGFKGVINLRGSVVPIIDMREKLGLPEPKCTTGSCIVVLDLTTDAKAEFAGMLVDRAEEVVNFDEDVLISVPKCGGVKMNDLVAGIGKYRGQFVMVLDAQQIFSDKEMCVMP